MKVAIITSGLLPVPAVKGGAIETLLDSFVEVNELEKKIQIDVYSINDRKARAISSKYKYTNYLYINQYSNLVIRFINKLFKVSIPINKYYQKKVQRMINKRTYDYVIIENYPELVLDLNRFKTIPYIHSDVFHKDIKNSEDILKKSHKVIAVSNFIKNRIIDINEAYKDKIFTVYNSIDFKSLSCSDYKSFRELFRKKYDIKDDDFVYVFSGRISEEKGVLQLVRAFNKIPLINKKLIIIGGVWYGSKKSNLYLKSIEKISGENVIFTGFIEHKEVYKILCASDIGIVPSICNEAAGLSVVEFMNTKNIVVASNRGGISEYLNLEGNYLVNYENEKQFIADLTFAMEKAYKNYSEYTKQCNSEYSKKFSTHVNYQSILKVLESGEQ